MLVTLFAFTLAVIEPAPVTAPASATESPAAEAAGAEQPLKPGERRIKVVCRTVTKPNSRFVKRHCTEINADAKQSDIDQEAFREAQSRPMFNLPCVPLARGCGQ